MPDRRPLPWIVLLAAALQIVAAARTPLPAQDGLKFIRIARDFREHPWADVVRRSDQHPLYPALIAAAQPAVEAVVGPGHHGWRIAAQGVSILATLALLVPLYLLARELFDRRVAAWSALLFVLLPMPAKVGHETLSDATALAAFTASFWLGTRALSRGRMADAVGCGLAGGLGFLARPEVALAPAVVAAVAVVRAGWRSIRDRGGAEASPGWSPPLPLPIPGLVAPMLAGLLVTVGAYALVKGEVSEKLALRWAAGIEGGPTVERSTPQWLPPGLDDPRWDFSPKEEWDHPTGLSPLSSLGLLGRSWFEGLGWALAPLAIWGAVRARAGWRIRVGWWLCLTYMLIFSAILLRHAASLGYLSSRHTLTMVVVAVPWASAALLLVGRRLSDLRGWSTARRARIAAALLIPALAASAAIQWQPGHPGRWGHLAAGRWLGENAGPGEKVLDTRGWAAFVSGLPGYDYWHVRQALTDPALAYVVVTEDELRAPTRRAETLLAVLDHAGEEAASFPDRPGGREPGVRVYRFRHPESWEGLEP